MHLIIRVVLVFFGLALLLFGVWDLVTPRARFVNSNPPPSAIIVLPPSAVTINFSNKLAPESSMDVTSTMELLPSGEPEYLDGRSVVMKWGIDPGDPSGKSLRADLRPGLHKGLYWVNWRTTAAGWRSITYGKTPFTVGMPVPDYITRDMDGTIWERTYEWRRRRAAIVGGVVMIALGMFLWMRK
ncbi:MAG: copper resistance protein CopC [Pyrinomonadaceae bacterium]